MQPEEEALGTCKQPHTRSVFLYLMQNFIDGGAVS